MSEPSKHTLAGRFSGVTKQQQGIRDERKSRETSHPVAALFVGLFRKVFGVVLIFAAQGQLERAEGMSGVGQYLFIGIGVALGVFGVFLLMPDVTMTFLRFFGLGGLVDKVLKFKNRQ